jgi:hypothetical protein
MSEKLSHFPGLEEGGGGENRDRPVGNQGESKGQKINELQFLILFLI